MNLIWHLDIDWARDGVGGSGNIDGNYLQSIRFRRGREHMIKSAGDGFERPKVGECVLVLRNDD